MNTLALARNRAEQLNFRTTRIDGRMVHATGFDADNAELRSIHPGSHGPAVLAANGGVTGPLAMESSYVHGAIRVRLLRGAQVVRYWDVADDAEHITRWDDEFTQAVKDLLNEDIEARQAWLGHRYGPVSA